MVTVNKRKEEVMHVCRICRVGHVTFFSYGLSCGELCFMISLSQNYNNKLKELRCSICVDTYVLHVTVGLHRNLN